MLDADSRTDDSADEAWHHATTYLLPSTTPTVSAHDPDFREIALSYCAAALNRTYDDSSSEPEEAPSPLLDMATGLMTLLLISNSLT
jgi:hypothetical protein